VTWTKLCDNIFADPRLLRVRAEVGHCAALLHVEALVYSNRVGTDGRIDRWCLPAVTPMPPREVVKWAAGLVAAGVWEETETGWRVLSGIEDQPSAEQVAAKRANTSAKRSTAGKAGAKARWGDGKMANGMANTKQSHGKPEWQTDGPVPTRPDPTSPDPIQTPKHTERVRDGGMATVEATGVDAEQAIVDLRDRTRRVMNLAHDLTSLSLWIKAVRGLDGQGHTAASYQALGDWIAAGGFWWWKQGRPTLAYLLRPGKLAEHLDDAAEWHRAGRPAVVKVPAPVQGALRAQTGRLRPAAPSSAADFAAERDEDDPLLAMLGD
jgi:hypothetical protein